MAKGDTEYSKKVPGARGNYKWPVRFDLTDGYLGVTQYDYAGKLKERVLLSPGQVRKLMAFAKQ